MGGVEAEEAGVMRGKVSRLVVGSEPKPDFRRFAGAIQDSRRKMKDPIDGPPA
jgi:hypothetical protein